MLLSRGLGAVGGRWIDALQKPQLVSKRNQVGWYPIHTCGSPKTRPDLLSCGNAFIAVVKSAELWDPDNPSSGGYRPRNRALLAKP